MLALACSAFFAVAGYPTFQVDCKRSPQRHIFPCSKMPLLGKIHANPNLKLVLQAQVPLPLSLKPVSPLGGVSVLEVKNFPLLPLLSPCHLQTVYFF